MACFLDVPGSRLLLEADLLPVHTAPVPRRTFTFFKSEKYPEKSNLLIEKCSKCQMIDDK